MHRPLVRRATQAGGSPGANGTDSSTFEYYAFAHRRACRGPARASTLPPSLTPAQILGIYNCTFTNWAQVGGGSGQIQRYEPQPGSGTRSFFESAFLGGLDPTTISTPSCPAVITTQANGLPLEENTGSEIDAVHYQQAIIPHSAGQWVFQSNNRINPTVDFRNGIRLGGIVATRKAANNTTLNDGTTTSGSTTVGSAGSGFTAGEVGAPISGSGIPSGDVIQSVAGDNSSVVVASSGATRTVTDGVTNKTIPCINTTSGSTNITINTSGGSCPASPSQVFVNSAAPTGDVGGVTSIGTGNGTGIPDGATIVSVTDSHPCGAVHAGHVDQQRCHQRRRRHHAVPRRWLQDGELGRRQLRDRRRRQGDLGGEPALGDHHHRHQRQRQHRRSCRPV